MADLQGSQGTYDGTRRRGSRRDEFVRRLKEQRYRLMGAALLFAALAVAGAMSVPIAFFAFLGLAALLMGEEAQEVKTAAGPAEPRLRDALPPNGRLGALVVEHLPDPVVLLDKSSRILYANRAAHDLMGHIPAGRPVASALRAPAVLSAIQKVQEEGGTLSIDYELPVPVERHFRAMISEIGPETGGELAREMNGVPEASLLIMLHDLTDMRRVEQMRVDFVANASHELKTPLASLSGFIETIQGHAKDDPEAQARFLGIMSEQAARMQRLIEDLLSLSRIEMREHVPPAGEVDLAALTGDVTDGLGPLAATHGVEINVDVKEGVEPVRGEWDELHQVVQNLTENALKYGRAGKRIDITIAPAINQAGRKMTELAIRDYGPGIPREHIPRLTERFYRVDVAKSRERGGTGLGLAIVKHIVNRHSGTLTIDSQVGEGSTFKVRLPVRAQARA